ncbi:MAG: hypothetical protein ACRDFA_06550, partial [bacterium]
MTKSRRTVIAMVAAIIAIAAAYLLFSLDRPARQTTETSGTPPGAVGMVSSSVSAAAKTAAAHASFASEGTSVSYVREHLGHVILCLEGPRGTYVNAAWENPCAGQGNGVLNELGSGGPSWN